jgi:xylulokinase
VGHLLGIDLGTSGARAILVEAASGRVVRRGERGISAAHAAAAVGRAGSRGLVARRGPTRCAGLLAAAGSVSVRGIGLSGQMHGVVMLDGTGEAIGPALLWCDGRTGEECREITERAGGRGSPARADRQPRADRLFGAQLLWLRRHQPDAFGRARGFLLPKDWIRFRLTGEKASEVSDASGTLLFDVARRTWSAAMMEILDLDSCAPAGRGANRRRCRARCRRPPRQRSACLPGFPWLAAAATRRPERVRRRDREAGLVSATIGSSGVVVRPRLGASARSPGAQLLPRSAGRMAPDGRDAGCRPLLRWLSERWWVAATTRLTGTQQLQFRQAPGTVLLFTPYLLGERTPVLDPQARGLLVSA